MVLTWKYFDGKVPSEHELPDTSEKRKKILATYNKAHVDLNASVKAMTRIVEELQIP